MAPCRYFTEKDKGFTALWFYVVPIDEHTTRVFNHAVLTAPLPAPLTWLAGMPFPTSWAMTKLIAGVCPLLRLDCGDMVGLGFMSGCAFSGKDYGALCRTQLNYIGISRSCCRIDKEQQVLWRMDDASRSCANTVLSGWEKCFRKLGWLAVLYHRLFGALRHLHNTCISRGRSTGFMSAFPLQGQTASVTGGKCYFAVHSLGYVI